MTMTLSQLRSIIIARANAVPASDLYANTLRVGVSVMVALLPLIYRLVRFTDRLQRSPKLRLRLWTCAQGGAMAPNGDQAGGGDGWWRTAMDAAVSVINGLGCTLEHLLLSQGGAETAIGCTPQTSSSSQVRH